MTPETLDALLKSGDTPILLDVRSSMEYKSGHIPGAIHAPLSGVVASAESATSDKKALMVLVCEHGPRAQMAKFFLKVRGYRNLDLLDGHMSRWRSANHQVQV